MKRTLQWVTMFTVAAGMTAMAQQQGASTPGMASSQSGQTVTVQGCLQSGAGMSGTHTMNTPAPGSTASSGTTAPTGSTAAPGAPGATVQSGQAAGAGRAGCRAAGANMYTLRVSDGGSGNARTGMPSSTAGQGDERSAAAQQGTGKVYHLMADGSTNLAAHVGHQIEVTGTLSAASGTRGGTSSGYPAASGSSGSGSTGAGAAVGTGTPAGSTSQAGTSTPAMGATTPGKAGAAGVLRVSNVKMIAATCR